MSRKIERHVEWVPSVFGNQGSEWVGYWNGSVRGRVRRLASGRYECSIKGRNTAYRDSMREAAKQLVCHVNDTPPSWVA